MIDVNLLSAGDTMLMRPKGLVLANGPTESVVEIVELDVDEAGDVGDFAVVKGEYAEFEINPRDYHWAFTTGIEETDDEDTVCGVCTRDLRTNPHTHDA